MHMNVQLVTVSYAHERTINGSLLCNERTISGSLLCTWWWNFSFHKMRGISWISEELSAFQEGLCYIELEYFIFAAKHFHQLTEQNWKDFFSFCILEVSRDPTP